MRAIVVNAFGGPEQLTSAQVEIPHPAPDEVLVRIIASGVNPVDLLLREGFAGGAQFPVVMGVDLSGIVEAVGKGVNRLKPGDNVYAHKKGGNGTYAEYAVLPEDWVALKPPSMTHLEAATIPCAALTAYQALTESLHIRSLETVLITGAAGGVGAFAVQIAASLGTSVVATARAINHKFLLELGANRVIDYTAEDFVSAVRNFYPTGVDAALSTVGGQTKRQTPLAIRDGGRFAWISSEENDSPELNRDVTGEAFYARADWRSLDQLTALIETGKLRTFVEQVYPLEKAHEAQRQMATGHVRGKLVITV